MKFKVKWIDRTEYEAEIEAGSEEEAREIFFGEGVESPRAHWLSSLFIEPVRCPNCTILPDGSSECSDCGELPAPLFPIPKA